MKPTPHKKRLAIYRHELERSGGHRLIADIEREANDALQRIIQHDTPPEGKTEVTQKEAVSRALRHYVKSKRFPPLG